MRRGRRRGGERMRHCEGLEGDGVGEDDSEEEEGGERNRK